MEKRRSGPITLQDYEREEFRESISRLRSISPENPLILIIDSWVRETYEGRGGEHVGERERRWLNSTTPALRLEVHPARKSVAGYWHDVKLVFPDLTGDGLDARVGMAAYWFVEFLRSTYESASGAVIEKCELCGDFFLSTKRLGEARYCTDAHRQKAWRQSRAVAEDGTSYKASKKKTTKKKRGK